MLLFAFLRGLFRDNIISGVSSDLTAYVLAGNCFSTIKSKMLEGIEPVASFPTRVIE